MLSIANEVDSLIFRCVWSRFTKYMFCILLVFNKSYHDSTNNENSSQSIMMFIIYLLPRNYRHGLACCCIFYGMVLLRFHTICLYAKLIISDLRIIFMFVIFRFKSWHILAHLLLFLIKANWLDPTMLTGKETWTLFWLLKSTNSCFMNLVLTSHH